MQNSAPCFSTAMCPEPVTDTGWTAYATAAEEAVHAYVPCSLPTCFAIWQNPAFGFFAASFEDSRQGLAVEKAVQKSVPCFSTAMCPEAVTDTAWTAYATAAEEAVQLSVPCCSAAYNPGSVIETEWKAYEVAAWLLKNSRTAKEAPSTVHEPRSLPLGVHSDIS